MDIKEFKAWMKGVNLILDGTPPSAEEWKLIVEEVEKLGNTSVITRDPSATPSLPSIKTPTEWPYRAISTNGDYVTKE